MITSADLQNGSVGSGRQADQIPILKRKPTPIWTHPQNTPDWKLRRDRLPPRQAEILGLIEKYHATTGSPCPVTHLARVLGLHHETIRESVAALFERRLVVGPGSPVMPSTPLMIPVEGRFSGRVVYFILDAGARLVKIGRTGDLNGRLRSLGRGRPGRLVLLGALAEDMREGDWHHRFRAGRVEGEWFALTPEIAAEIRARFGLDLTPQNFAGSVTADPAACLQP